MGDAATPPLLPEESLDTWEADLVDPTGVDVTRGVGGVVVLVTTSKTEVHGMGLPEVGAAAPPDGTTCFQLGSVSKVFTGLILAGLVEQSDNGINADDAVNDHLDGVSVPTAPWGQVITLQALASHTSGLVSFPLNPTGRQPSPFSGYGRMDLKDFLETSLVEEVFNDESGYAYSNLGIGLLGVALADATSVGSFEALLDREIVQPLGMTSTGLNSPAFVDRVENQLAEGYWATGGELSAFGLSEMGVLAASGEIIASGDDVARFLRIMIGRDEYPIRGAVERAITIVHDRPAPNAHIAYAWDITSAPSERTRYEKAGVTAGYTTYLAFHRDPAVAVAVIVNRGRLQLNRDAARALLTELANAS